MDLAKLDLVEHANKGAVMEVMHPITGENLLDREGKAVTITLLGADSSQMRNEMSDRARKQLAKKQTKQIPSIDDAESASAELLSAITVSWSGIEENGELIQCNRENAKTIYTKYGWLRLQVDSFVSDQSNFFKA